MFINNLRPLLIFLEGALLLAPIVFLFLRRRGRLLDSFHPLLVFSVAFSLFYFFPQVYYYLVSDTSLFNDDPSLAISSLLWSIIAIAAFNLGYIISGRLGWRWRVPFRSDISRTTLAVIALFLTGIGVASYALFVGSIEGFVYYVTHQNDTIALTSGKMYIVWGILLTRTSFLVHLLYRVRNYQINRKALTIWGWLLLLAHGLLALMFIMTIGSRLLILSFLIEGLVLLHYSVRSIKFHKLLLVGSALFILFVLVFGAWRNYGWEIESKGRPFVTYLQDDISTNLGPRLFNSYFDSTRNFSFALKYTDHGLPIQYGRTYLSLLVQPIPRDHRPTLVLPYGPEVNGLHCSTPKGGAICGIDPLLSELYQNFSVFGIPIVLLLFGLFSGVIYQSLILSWEAENFSYLIYGIFVYSIFLWLRGTFVGHTSLILMDLLPLLLLQIFFNKSQPHKAAGKE